MPFITMSALVADVSDFQFRGLQKIRLFDGYIQQGGSGCAGLCYVAASSEYGIVAVATPDKRLLSMRSSDVHALKSTKSNINTEATIGHLKTTHLGIGPNDELISLGCSCSGRVLSVLINTTSGPLVQLYDFCALSPDFPSPAGVVSSVRVSSEPQAKGITLDWNPRTEGLFSVIASDGTLSTFQINLETPAKMSIVGTTKLKAPGRCLSWSPKGKQLIVGDSVGTVLQYKPEMVLVRTIPAPTNVPSMQEKALRCTGICWLSTTEILVAYSPQNGQSVDVALLRVSKEARPQWVHFEDVNFCSDRCSFPQNIFFTPLFHWHLILCSSSRSCEVAVIGKRGSEWKLWNLEDFGRIEMPVNSAHEESYPVGVCIDLSSQLSVKLNESDSVERLPCPIVMVLSSHGLLLPFNALSTNESHPSINKPPSALPSKVIAGTPPLNVEALQRPVPHTVSMAPAFAISLANPLSSSVARADLPVGPPSGLFQTAATAFTAPPPTAFSQRVVPKVNLASVEPSMTTTAQVVESSSSAPATVCDEMPKLRAELQKNLFAFDLKHREIREINDWAADLKSSVERNVKGWENKWSSEEEDDLEEVEKMRCEVNGSLEKVEEVLRDAISAMKARKECVLDNEATLLHSASAKMLDFNNSYHMRELSNQFEQLERKITEAERSLSKISLRSMRNSSSARCEMLSAEDEQKIYATARNVCKAMNLRRKALIDLHQKFTEMKSREELSTRGSSAELRQKDALSIVPSSASNYVKSGRLNFEEDFCGISLDCSHSSNTRQNKLLGILDRRAHLASVLSKANILLLSPHEAVQSSSSPSSELKRLESRLQQVIASPIQQNNKKMLDIGTQSPISSSQKAGSDAQKVTAVNGAVSSLPVLQAESQSSPADPNDSSGITLRGPPFGASSSLSVPVSFVTTAAIPPLAITNTFASRSSTVPSFKSQHSVSKPKPQEVPSVSAQLETSSVSLSPAAAVTISDTLAPSKPAVMTSVQDRPIASTVLETSTDVIPRSTSAGVTAASTIFAVASSTGTVPSTIPVTSAPASLFGQKPVQQTAALSTATVTAVTSSAAAVSHPASVSITTAAVPAPSTSPVSFSFVLPGSTSQTNPPVSSAASNTAAQTTIDEGMMDEEGSSAATTNLFSSSLSLGSSSSNTNSLKNIFGGTMKLGGATAASSGTSNLFGGAASRQASSVFGGGSNTVQRTGAPCSSLFGGNPAVSTSATSSPASTFSFSAALAQPERQQNPSSLFSSNATGGTATFGGAPTFGSRPTFGAASPLVSSTFGQTRPAAVPSSGGFSAFSRGNTLGFGALAAASQQQSSGSSLFGGTGFGALAAQSQSGTSSIFGGGVNLQSKQTSSSFSSWR